MASDQAIIKSILLSAPPGQFDIILEDLRSLLPKSSASSTLDPSFVAAVRSEWEASTGRSVLASSESAGASSGNGCTDALSKAMDEYLALKFSSAGVRAAHDVTASAADTITIATYAERVDLHNHHAGSWKGSYTFCPSSGSLCGSVSIRAHIWENGGNVQLHSDITLDAINVGTCPADDSEKQASWAQGVVRQIEVWEDKDVMDQLTTMFDSVGNTYLKSLRRVMPITRTKMNWNVLAHRVRQTLGEGHDKDKFKH